MKKLLTFLVTLALVFTIAGCTNEPENTDDADNAADAAKKLSLDISDPLSVTSNIDFPTAGLHNATITWSTNNTAVIANDGTVTRPAIGANPVTVVITATVKVGKEEVSKDFTVKVLAAVPSSAMTIAQFIAAADDTVVELTGVVTGTIQGKGFHMADATGHTYIYLGVSTDYVLGDEVTVMGTKDTYYNIPELTFVTSNEKISSGNTLPAFVDTDIPTIYLEDNEDTDIYNTMIKLSGVVEIVGANNNVNLVWFDANMNKQYVEVYYKSGDTDKVAALRALKGKFVSVEAILMDYYSSGWWRISVNSNSTITELTLTDQQKADYAAAGLDLGNLSALDHSLQLDTTGDYSSTIAWASTNEAVIATDGTVTGATGTTEVTLTATVTVGTATATKTFTASVLDASALPLTVAQAKATAAGTVVNVTGVISGFAGMKPFIQDSDGTAMFVDSDIEAEVGDLVEISGEVFGFDDSGYTTLVAIELKDATLTKIVSSGNTVFVKTVTDVADIFTNFPGNAGERVTLTNVTILTLDDTHSHTIITSGTGEIKIYTPAFLVDGFFTNNIIPEMTFNIQHINFGDVKLEDVVFGALTDAQKMLIAKSMLVLPDSTTVNLELPTEFADYGATISWVSSNLDALANDGTVVRPEHADGDAVLTLTASITVNGVTEDVIFDITVTSKPGVAVPEVFFSEIIEGYSYNKAIELYNPTGADVDLSQYSIMENHGGYVLTTVLSGTLAAGDVYVICNDQLDAGTDLDTNCDIKLTGNPDVPNFNGNDTLQLLKNGNVIDQFYPESAAGGNDFSKDTVMVRNANVVEGVTVFDLSQWTAYAADDYTHVGSHTMDPITVDDNSELFFSEIVEHTSNNKAIEIYNPTGADVDLSGYFVNENYGGDTPGTYALTGTLAAGDVFVLCTDQVETALDTHCDVKLSFPSVVHFGGNDTLQLLKGTTVIDQFGVDADAGGADFNKDQIFIRNAGITQGSDTFNTSEWTVVASADYVYATIGSHSASE